MDALTPQQLIMIACEEDLERYGDSFRGAGYTKSPEEAIERYELMLEAIREPGAGISVLDVGCGLAHLLDYSLATPKYSGLRYVGLDLSARYLTAARLRHPDHEFIEADLLGTRAGVPVCDYVILNGLFNYRGPIVYDRMVDYWQRMVTASFAHARVGMAFNVMSTLVDWERDDLFHLPIEAASSYVWRHLSRHFTIRHDYRAFEYTTYVYRQPFSMRSAGTQV